MEQSNVIFFNLIIILYFATFIDYIVFACYNKIYRFVCYQNMYECICINIHSLIINIENNMCYNKLFISYFILNNNEIYMI